MKETLDLVDEDDNIIGKIERSDCLKQAAIHRSVMIIVTNPKGEYLIQKRSGKKQLYPGMYEIGIGETLKSGETYEEGALREINEEAGIDCILLEYLFHINFRSEHNNCNRRVYRCTYDGKMRLQKEEVETGKFVTIAEAKKMMAHGRLSPSAIHVFTEYLRREEK